MMTVRDAEVMTEQLPYIDEHARQIDAPPDEVWRALLATVRQIAPSLPAWLSAAWGLQYRERSGQGDEATFVGSTVPGFVAAEVEPSRLLVLRGRHRFSVYELRFELERPDIGGTYLRAKTSAAFPGAKGRVYRMFVIGTRGHRTGVRQMLAKVARRAENAD